MKPKHPSVSQTCTGTKKVRCRLLTSPKEEHSDPVFKVTLGQTFPICLPRNQSKPNMDTDQRRNNGSRSLGARAHGFIVPPSDTLH